MLRRHRVLLRTKELNYATHDQLGSQYASMTEPFSEHKLRSWPSRSDRMHVSEGNFLVVCVVHEQGRNLSCRWDTVHASFRSGDASASFYGMLKPHARLFRETDRGGERIEHVLRSTWRRYEHDALCL